MSFPWRGFAFVGLTVLGICCLGLAGGMAVWLVAPLGFAVAVVTGVPGAFVAYVGLAGLLNRTTIVVAGATLAVRHGPVPLVRGVQIPVAGIAQLHVWARPLGPRTGPITRVWAFTDDGRRIPLTWYILDDRFGLAPYIERRVERQLRIIDRPIVCPQCGYDLRASRRRCPECGLRVRTTVQQRRPPTSA